MAEQPVYIFDLDGTILDLNSFPRWVIYLLRGRFGQLGALARLRLSLETALVLALRKAHLMPHVAAKRRFQTLWAQALARDPQALALQGFVAQMQKHVRPGMAQAMQKAQATGRTVLATAAAAEYAQALGQALGFHHVIATPSAASGFGDENVRARKRENVLAFLQAQGWGEAPRVFFTDHAEDLPLIQTSQIVFWFGADAQAPAMAQQAPQARIIPCLTQPSFADQL